MAKTVEVAFESMTKSIERVAEEIAAFAASDSLEEEDMIKFNMLASQYSVMMSLTSGLVKTLTDAEQSVAQKM